MTAHIHNIYNFNDIIARLDNASHQKNNYLSKKKNISIKIKKVKEDIEKSKKNIVEKIIELLTFGIISYTSKYNNIIKEYKYELLLLHNNELKIKQTLVRLEDEIKELRNEFIKKINVFKQSLIDYQNKLIYLSEERYINQYLKETLLIELKKLIMNKEEFLQHNEIKPYIDTLYAFKKNPNQWIDNKNILFVKNEKIKEKVFFDTIESMPLTSTQQDAVLINENNNLILAGAGSGKTSVIVAKVSYLIQKKIVHPSEILVLAFNKNAQQELEERFKNKNINIAIKTFHSFGITVIAQEFSQKFNLCPMAESQNNMTKFIKNTIQNLMASKSEFLNNFVNFMAYFKLPYKNESEFQTLGDYYDYQKSLDMKSLKHKVIEKGRNNEKLITLKEETVKSHQELVICNFLTLNGIRYLYEYPYKHKTSTVEKTQYQPDFYLPDYDIYIEHFGIDRNNKTAPYVDNTEYLAGIEWKRTLHKEKGTILVETFSYEFDENNLLQRLKEKLLQHNVLFRELEFAEIKELLKEPIEDNEFTKLFTTFLNHYKSNRHDINKLKTKSYEIERTTIFLQIFEFILIEYQKFQERNNCIDFDDMIVKALETIELGKYEHGYKHIFIDEFQDISTTRAKLIKSLLPLNNTSITAVGDDWQSINRFAGSNIQIIQDFKKVFGVSKTIKLDYTFRFNNIISNTASTFIQKNPNQIRKTIKTIKNQELNLFSILIYWTTGNRKDDVEKILKYINKKNTKKQKHVMILSRYNFSLKDVRPLSNVFNNLKISFSTVHGSKGNEADYVIIMDLNKGKYGFPSKIEDDPILDIVIPKGETFEDAEERRLFYVALTRTKGTTFLLADQYNKSPFIKEIIEENKDEIYFINDPKIKLQHCEKCKTGLMKKRTASKNNNNHFYGCSNYPRCKHTENIHYCPNCKEETYKDLENKLSKCSNKSCDFQSPLCIECNANMIERKGEYGLFLGCMNYPKCRYTIKI